MRSKVWIEEPGLCGQAELKANDLRNKKKAIQSSTGKNHSSSERRTVDKTKCLFAHLMQLKQEGTAGLSPSNVILWNNVKRTALFRLFFS